MNYILSGILRLSWSSQCSEPTTSKGRCRHSPMEAGQGRPSSSSPSSMVEPSNLVRPCSRSPLSVSDHIVCSRCLFVFVAVYPLCLWHWTLQKFMRNVLLIMLCFGSHPQHGLQLPRCPTSLHPPISPMGTGSSPSLCPTHRRLCWMGASYCHLP